MLFFVTLSLPLVKTKVKFISRTFFTGFYDKVKADYSQNIYDDESNFISTCYKHVKGLKCEMRIDGNLNIVTVSGVGHRLWRKEYSPKVAFFFFCLRGTLKMLSANSVVKSLKTMR